MQISQNPQYSNNVTFQNIGFFKARKISKYFTKSIPYCDKEFNKFLNLIEVNNQNSVSNQLMLLLERAKKMITESQTNNTAYAKILLLFRGKKEDLKSLNIEAFYPIFWGAVADLDARILERFTQIDNFNWNMLNRDGDNIALKLFKAYIETWWNKEGSFKKFQDCLKILKNLPKDKLDINYVNPEGDSVFTYTISKTRCSSILLENFEELDVNRTRYGKLSPVAQAAENEDMDLFEKIINHPQFKPENINQAMPYINKITSYKGSCFLKIIEDNQDMTFKNKIKKIYNEQGTFTIDELMTIVNYPNYGKFANMNINSINERIGHILVDIYPKNQEEEEKLDLIFKKLAEVHYYFNHMDCLKKTGLEKAIEAENHFVADLFRKYMGN